MEDTSKKWSHLFILINENEMDAESKCFYNGQVLTDSIVENKEKLSILRACMYIHTIFQVFYNQ